jgi:hypothetical protein
MKKVTLLGFSLLCCLVMSAQTVMNTGYLQVTLNKNILKSEDDSSGVCTLDSTNGPIYMHSGAGYKSSTSLWDAVVGNWGLADGIGAMTTLSDTTFTICLDLTLTASNYYSNPNTANADSGVMPVGSDIFNIGVVFRAASGFPTGTGGQVGLDNNLKGAGPTIDARGQCADIWLIGVNSDSVGDNVQPINVTEEDFVTSIPAVTATWVTGCTANGVKDISSQLFDDIRVSPNPFRESVTVQFNMIADATKVQAQVYDVMGQKVADFSANVKNGYNSITWDGAGPDGRTLPGGTYLLKVSNGSDTKTTKLIKL